MIWCYYHTAFFVYFLYIEWNYWRHISSSAGQRTRNHVPFLVIILCIVGMIIIWYLWIYIKTSTCTSCLIVTIKQCEFSSYEVFITHSIPNSIPFLVYFFTLGLSLTMSAECHKHVYNYQLALLNKKFSVELEDCNVIFNLVLT